MAARLLDDTMITDSKLLSAGITQSMSRPLFTSTLKEEPAKGDKPDEPEDPEPPDTYRHQQKRNNHSKAQT